MKKIISLTIVFFIFLVLNISADEREYNKEFHLDIFQQARDYVFEYVEDPDCNDFSDAAVKLLNFNNVQSFVAIGSTDNETRRHAYVLIAFEPQTGEFIKNNDWEFERIIE